MTYSFECASNLHCFHFICVERLCFTCPIISGVAPLAVWPRPVMGNIVAIDRLARTIIRAALIRARKTIRIQPFWICAVVWGGLSGSAPLASVGGGLSPRFQVPVPPVLSPRPPVCLSSALWGHVEARFGFLIKKPYDRIQK